MWTNEKSTFEDMPGNEVKKLKEKEEQKRAIEEEKRVREEEERVREEEERKILYKFNIGDKIKVKKIAEIYKHQLDINIGQVGEISRIFDYVNNKISFGKKIGQLDKSTRKEVFCTDIDLSEEFPDGIGTEPGPEAPDIIYDILFNIVDNEYPDNPGKNKWVELYFSEDGIEKMNKGGKRKKRKKSLFKKKRKKKGVRGCPPKRTKRRRRKTRRRRRRKTRMKTRMKGRI